MNLKLSEVDPKIIKKGDLVKSDISDNTGTIISVDTSSGQWKGEHGAEITIKWETNNVSKFPQSMMTVVEYLGRDETKTDA